MSTNIITFEFHNVLLGNNISHKNPIERCFMFVVCFGLVLGATSSSAQGFLLALHSGITLSFSRHAIRVPEFESRLVVCKASTPKQ